MMATGHELRHLCLLAAAGRLAYYPAKDDAASSRYVRDNVRCVLYLIVAFSLRRQNLGRRNLRPSPNNPNSPNSSRLRYLAYNASRTFRSKIKARLSSLNLSFLRMKGCQALPYM